MMFFDISESVRKVGTAIVNDNSSYLVNRKKHQRLKDNDLNVCYLVSGTVSVFCKKNNLLVLTLSAPAIIGLTQLSGYYGYHYWRCTLDCQLWTINNENANKLFTDSNLWHDVFQISTHNFLTHFHNIHAASGKTVQEITISLLKEIWALEPSSRKKVSVYNFILQRSSVSRTAVYNVIHKLVCDEKINIERGKLINMKDDCS